jgi:hypothetical protein
MATAPSRAGTPLSSSCYARCAAHDSGAHVASPVFFSERITRCQRRVKRITTRRATSRATKYGAKKNLLDSRRQSRTMACCRCARGNATQRHAAIKKGDTRRCWRESRFEMRARRSHRKAAMLRNHAGLTVSQCAPNAGRHRSSRPAHYGTRTRMQQKSRRTKSHSTQGKMLISGLGIRL